MAETYKGFEVKDLESTADAILCTGIDHEQGSSGAEDYDEISVASKLILVLTPKEQRILDVLVSSEIESPELIKYNKDALIGINNKLKAAAFGPGEFEEL
jgi:hypothetical protein